MSRDAILLTAHGSVEDLAEIPAFLSRIRRGRPPPQGLVEELTRRYRAIGGSPLLRITERQAKLLAERIQKPVFVGMRLWKPELGDALVQASNQGAERVCVLPLAPYSVPVYLQAARLELARLQLPAPPRLVAAQPFGNELVEAHVRSLRPWLDPTDADATEVILTAHSLPLSVIASGDPYARLVEANCREIQEQLGRPVVLGYQSQGADGGEWLGPGLREVLLAARRRGLRRVVVVPIGFLCDHVETLYDLDVEARTWATELGLTFVRIPALNDAPELIGALARVAELALSH